jgi:hypothetical protein
MYDQGGAAYNQPAYVPPGNNTGYAAPMMGGGPAYGQPIQQPQPTVPYQQQQQQPGPYGSVGGGYMPVPQQQQQQPMVAAVATAAVPRQAPPIPPQPVAAVAALWKAATSPDGQIYYYNERTGETQWEKPPGMP